MRRIALPGILAGLLVTAVHAQPADRAAPPATRPAPPAVRPPDVMAVVEHSGRGYTHYDLATLTPDGTTQVVLGKMPSGSYSLAVHPATGRWAMSFGQLANGDPLVIDGEPVSRPQDRNTLVFGERAAIVAAVLGDPGCSNATRACYEPVRGFSDDGRFAYVEVLRSSGSLWNRWTFGAKPARALIADKTTAGTLERERDGGRAVYLRGTSAYVTTFPKQPASLKSKATKLKAAAKATLTPKLLMSSVTPIGDALYYFRREPEEQATGWVERFDLKTKKTTAVFQPPEQFPMWDSPFLSTGPRETVLFAHQGDDALTDLYEVGAADASAARRLGDLRALLDVSADGRFVLVSRYRDPALGESPGNELTLVVFDLVERRTAAMIRPGADVLKVEAARFVAPPAP